MLLFNFYLNKPLKYKTCQPSKQFTIRIKNWTEDVKSLKSQKKQHFWNFRCTKWGWKGLLSHICDVSSCPDLWGIEPTRVWNQESSWSSSGAAGRGRHARWWHIIYKHLITFFYNGITEHRSPLTLNPVTPFTQLAPDFLTEPLLFQRVSRPVSTVMKVGGVLERSFTSFLLRLFLAALMINSWMVPAV